MDTPKPQLLGLGLWALALLGAAAALVLFFLDPATVGIYPVCYFHRLTGLQCPGCGGLRAAHQLLHGHVVAAFRLNGFLVLSLPFVGFLFLRALVQCLKRQPPSFALKPAWLWTGLVLLVLFGVARNVLG